MKSASAIVEDAISEMSSEIKQNNYTYKLTKSIEGNHPRIEIMFFRVEQ